MVTRLETVRLYSVVCALALSAAGACTSSEDDSCDEEPSAGSGGDCDCGTPAAGSGGEADELESDAATGNAGDAAADDAGDAATDEGPEIPFAKAEIKIEINATDGDSGLQIFLDATGWEFVDVFDPSGNRVFHVEGGAGVKQTGLTELYFESAEPGFSVLPLEKFLERFPEGVYRFEGRTTEGERMAGEATLTHALPDGPNLVSPAEDSVQDLNHTVVEWEPVADPKGSKIVNYQVIVEQEEPTLRVLDAMLPATATTMTVPPEFLAPDRDFKFEVLALEESGNQTLSESTFRTAP